MRGVSATISVVLGVLAFSGIAHAKDSFKAKLTGAQEVPPVVTETTGRAKIKFNKDETAAEFELTVHDGTRVTQAHLHCAPAGANGPIIVFLAGLHAAGLDVDGKWISHATMTNTSIINGLCGTTLSAIAQSMRNGLVYVNVHTVARPGGEVRGQLEQD